MSIHLLVSIAWLGLATSGENPFVHDVRPGPGVTATKMLSDYFPALARTPGDTPVYVLEGAEPGGTAFVAGGTHGNEIAGIVAATTLVERGLVTRGRLIVIPHANNSAIAYTDPKRPGPEWVTVQTAAGPRRFKYGARLTKPEHQGEADPAKYRHPKSAEELEGFEARNLDRAYPGRPDGNLTQKIAWAVMQLLKAEKVDVAFDLHESGPESRLAWMVVANPKNVDIAALAIVELDGQGIPMKLEPSSESFRGLSHREWGDGTGAAAFLFETPNPAMVDKARGADPVNDASFPLSRRVTVQLRTLYAVLAAFADGAPPERHLTLTSIP